MSVWLANCEPFLDLCIILTSSKTGIRKQSSLRFSFSLHCLSHPIHSGTDHLRGEEVRDAEVGDDAVAGAAAEGLHPLAPDLVVRHVRQRGPPYRRKWINGASLENI